MILLGYAETTIMFPFRLCGDMLPVEVIRERRYGPNRLRVNDDDESRHHDTAEQTHAVVQRLLIYPIIRVCDLCIAALGLRERSSLDAL